MNQELAYSSTVEIVTKYRKLLSWWTFVRVTPRLMHSNIDDIYDLLERYLRQIIILMNDHIRDVANYRSEISDSVAFACKTLKLMEERVYNLFEQYQKQFTKYFYLWGSTVEKLN
ncbi:hypothetical protein CEXT_583861 [Caerostris extrusa]|uniref:Dynein heavy chain tail domain-containing protein n=1 Tax=Caerostris extrusa TaxID=172846 RepID=A0AAV4RYX5_CAEEX|nr:hypothetical protein CEXT_583861 [Caerostris extrusa]